MSEVILSLLTLAPAVFISVCLIWWGLSERKRAKDNMEWVAYMRKKYPFLNK